MIRNLIFSLDNDEEEEEKEERILLFFCFLILMLKAANLRYQGSFWLGPSSPLHCDMLHLHCALHCEVLCYAFYTVLL